MLPSGGRSTNPRGVALAQRLLEDHHDHASIAAVLNQAGIKTARGKYFTAKNVLPTVISHPAAPDVGDPSLPWPIFVQQEVQSDATFINADKTKSIEPSVYQARSCADSHLPIPEGSCRGDNGPMRLPVIRAQRLLLRPWMREDVGALYELWTAPEVRRYLWDDVVITREAAEQVVQLQLATADRHGIGDWTLHLLPTVQPAGEPIGG